MVMNIRVSASFQFKFTLTAGEMSYRWEGNRQGEGNVRGGKIYPREKFHEEMSYTLPGIGLRYS